MSGTDHFSRASYTPGSRKTQSAISETMTRLKTYGEHCVVGEKECVGNNRPCEIPRDFLLIDEDAHKLDDSKSGMGLKKLSSAVNVITCTES